MKRLLPVLATLALFGLAGCSSSSSGTSTQETVIAAPVITGLSPASLAAGSAAQTLTVTGTGFRSTSTVSFQGTARTTTFVGATTLTVALTAEDLATAGTAAVLVTNPSGEGGASAAATFTVTEAVAAPVIETLSPSTLVAGSGAQTLTVTGTGFRSDSTVSFAGVDHTTTYVDATTLTIALTASELTTAGSKAVVVSNPAEEGGDSASIAFTVTSPVLATAYLTPQYLDRTYKISSSFWNKRYKNILVNWIPHLISQLSNTSLAEGGINNFVLAGKELAGTSHGSRLGLVFSDSYTLKTVEAMCDGLMVDPQGDADIIAAQASMTSTLEDWIPKILSAQESDGYLQTAITLGMISSRWSDHTAHEGYVGGYFIEAALAHYLMSGKTDSRLYDAARKLADCWVTNIGPSPKKTWYDGHEEMEQALTHLARFVAEEEGDTAAAPYTALAKFLLEARVSGPTDSYDPDYDQSGKSAVDQTRMVGHAVRMIYLANGIATVGQMTGDTTYTTAADTLWNNLVNAQWYITGGIGSGATSEGFGDDYALPNSSYCESCAGCGTLVFNHSMHLGKMDAKYADLMETTLYNAVLGDLDLDALNYGYTNPLDQAWSRYAWHTCPCCVGNIPRTIFSMPTWMYSKSSDSLYVNLFVGSTVTVGNVAGTDVEMVQATDYPNDGKVNITVNPAVATSFKLRVRSPQRDVSTLYTSDPAADGFTSISVNGTAITPTLVNGYAVIDRTWTAGDKVAIVLPMTVQRVTASSLVAADQNRVALRYGPMMYNIESVDYDGDTDFAHKLDDSATLTAGLDSTLLGESTMLINGTFKDGTALVAVPNYARENRGGRTIVWIKRPSSTVICPISEAATVSTSYCSSWQSVDAVKDQIVPTSSADDSAGAYGNWAQGTASTEWIEYDFDQAHDITSTSVYWWVDGSGIAMPSAWKMQYWDAATSAFVDLASPSGYPLNVDAWSTCTFPSLNTTKVRIVITPGTAFTGILEWEVN